jgi:IclR family acetate operon transcriptional repressor
MMDEEARLPKKDTNIIQSLDKGLHLLEVVEKFDHPPSLKDLHLQLGWEQATIHRLLTTLVRRGYLVRDETEKRYKLGWKIYSLYGSMREKLSIQEIARPYLVKLSKETGESAHLAMASEGFMVFIETVQGSELVTVNTQIGDRVPMYCTAIGKAYLAYDMEADIHTMYKETLPQYTEHTVETVAELAERLGEVRKVGYAFDDEEYISGIRCAAAPILDESGSPIASIGVSGPKYRLPIRKCREHGNVVRSIALEISRSFGFSMANRPQLS